MAGYEAALVVGLVFALPLVFFVAWVVRFPREHGGLGLLAHRGIEKSGERATAKIVSDRVIGERMAGSRRYRYLIQVTEYLLDVTRDDGTTFRTSATLPVPMSMQSKIARAHPLPVRVRGDRVVIDRDAVDAMAASKDAAKKAAADREFEEKRNAPPGT